MSGNEQIGRGLCVISGLLAVAIGTPAHGAPPAVRVISAGASEVSALRDLGDDVRFFTSRGRPLRALSEIRDPGVEVGSADLELARGVMALLRAGGVRFAGGAFDVMTLASDNQLASLFERRKGLRLLLVRARPGGAEAVVARRGGGVPLAFRAPSGELLGAPPAAAGRVTTVSARAEGRTSFGTIRRVERSPTARQRIWERVSAKVEEKKAGPGRTFVIVRIDRDFSAGLGKVAYLFGSGVILDPDFSQLVVLDGARRHTPAAVYDDGPRLDLAYELPSGARNLRLQDGDVTFPLGDRIAAAP